VSIVIRPGQFSGEPHPVGKLASTLLSVTLAGMADPPRFRRGKSYVADRAVTRLEISTGVLRATVLGSRSDPYEVIVTVTVVDRPTLGNADSLRPLLARLTPESADLMVSCTCPDWDEPCKHAVAAVLAFANELTTRPELLLEWRCHPADTPPERARVGSRTPRPGERHLRLAPQPPSRPAPRKAAPVPVSPWATPEWQQFLGQVPFPDAPAVHTDPVTVGHAMLGTIDLGSWVRSAIAVLTSLE
jgi:hypothetical protein